MRGLGGYDLSNIEKPISIWIPIWLNAQSKSVLIILVSVILGSCLLLTTEIFHWFQKKTNEEAVLNVFISVTVIISLLFWWKSGPNPRFIYGVLFFLFAYLGAVLSSNLNVIRWLRFGPLITLIPLLVISKTILNEDSPERPLEFLTIQNTNGTIYYPAETDKCWEHGIPCANMNRHNLKLRGSGLQDGFANTSN